ncbi:MAG TPA: carbohydrate ABC transporter permease [Chloroflexota bacterium]|nr:carbohydrate ABC transporter permease [Chloroflexota bacterium]
MTITSTTAHPTAPPGITNALLARKSFRRHLQLTLATIIIVVGAAGVLVPFAWMLSTSVKPDGEVFLVPVHWIPQRLQLSNFATATATIPFWRYAANSVYITVLVVIGSVLSSSLVAFAFARLRARGRDMLFIILLSTLMLPGEVTLVSTYLIFKYLGWLDTFNPLIVPHYFGSAFYIFLLRQFYLTLPHELDDAAKIDGCGYFGIYSRIVLPLSKPALATVAIFSFFNSWNAFQGPLIYLNTMEKYTIPVGLNFFIDTQNGTPWNQLMAASVLAMIPCVVVFFFAQRTFIQGAVLTGLKG